MLFSKQVAYLSKKYSFLDSRELGALSRLLSMYDLKENLECLYLPIKELKDNDTDPFWLLYHTLPALLKYLPVDKYSDLDKYIWPLVRINIAWQKNPDRSRLNYPNWSHVNYLFRDAFPDFFKHTKSELFLDIKIFRSVCLVVLKNKAQHGGNACSLLKEYFPIFLNSIPDKYSSNFRYLTKLFKRILDKDNYIMVDFIIGNAFPRFFYHLPEEIYQNDDVMNSMFSLADSMQGDHLEYESYFGKMFPNFFDSLPSSLKNNPEKLKQIFDKAVFIFENKQVCYDFFSETVPRLSEVLISKGLNDPDQYILILMDIIFKENANKYVDDFLIGMSLPTKFERLVFNNVLEFETEIKRLIALSKYAEKYNISSNAFWLHFVDTVFFNIPKNLKHDYSEIIKKSFDFTKVILFLAQEKAPYERDQSLATIALCNCVGFLLSDAPDFVWNNLDQYFDRIIKLVQIKKDKSNSSTPIESYFQHRLLKLFFKADDATYKKFLEPKFTEEFL